MELPLEILDLIFKELCLEDKLQLAKTATFLKDAFIVSCGNDFHQITLEDSSETHWPCVVQLCGSYVEDFCMKIFDAQTYRLLEKNCPNLKTLQIALHEIENVTLVKSLLLGVKNLKTLRLVLVEMMLVPVADEVTHSLPDLPNLKEFGIRVCSSIKKDFFDLGNVLKWANLEKLDITEFKLKPQKYPKIKINEIFTSLKRLSWLQLNGLNIVSTIGEMESYSSLEVLKIECCTLSSVFPNCPSLRHLKVRQDQKPAISSNVNMLKCFENQSNSLESLDIDDAPLEFYSAWMDTNEFPALKQLYYKGSGRTKWPNCPKLQFLRLKHHPHNIETFNWISRHAETLENLDLSVNDNFKSSDWPYLPQLRSMCLRLPLDPRLHPVFETDLPYLPQHRSVRLPPDHTLDVAFEWISKQSETLYSLEMRGRLNVVDVCKLISCCKKVRRLSISWHMGLFEQSWFSFFDTLKENKVFLNEPFIVKIYSWKNIEADVKWLFLQKLAKSPNFELCKFQFKLYNPHFSFRLPCEG